MSNWIPVTEQLPELNDEVVVWSHSDSPYARHVFLAERWTWNDPPRTWTFFDSERGEIENVTHWQPLPSAPEQKP